MLEFIKKVVYSVLEVLIPSNSKVKKEVEILQRRSDIKKRIEFHEDSLDIAFYKIVSYQNHKPEYIEAGKNFSYHQEKIEVLKERLLKTV